MKTIVSRALACLSISACLAAGAQGSEVELINLYDAFGAPVEGVTQDFGFSMLVRYRGQTILFDSGTDAAVFERNLKALGIDPREIDVAIASHNHHDHIAGFDYLLEVHPEVKIFLPNDFTLGGPVPFPLTGTDSEAGSRLPAEMRYFGGDKDATVIASSGRFRNADTEYVAETKQIADGITLIATQSELMGVFVRYPPHEHEPALLPMPELSLSLKTPEGEILVVGCSHSGVEAIVAKARDHLQKDIRLLVGGYHLLPYDAAYIEALARRLRKVHRVQHVAPAHCSGHLASELFRQAFAGDYRLFGLGSVLEY